MASNKRTDYQKELDYAEEASLYLRGHTQAYIAQHISANRDYQLSRVQIHMDLKKVQQRWLESSLVDFNQLKAQELAKIDELEKAYWEGWASSLEQHKKEELEQTEDTDGRRPTYTRKKGKRITEERDGNVTFLQGVERCIEQRCKILGLYAPEKSVNTINWRQEAVKAGIEDPDAEVETLVNQFLEAAQKSKDE